MPILVGNGFWFSGQLLFPKFGEIQLDLAVQFFSKLAEMLLTNLVE